MTLKEVVFGIATGIFTIAGAYALLRIALMGLAWVGRQLVGVEDNVHIIRVSNTFVL